MDAFELKLKRFRSGLRQYEVAAQVGIAPCRLSEIEAGRREADPELLQKILKVIEKTERAEHGSEQAP